MSRKPFSARSIRSLPPGVHADAGQKGLYLHVAESGSRSWLLRTVVHGRRREIGLGSLEWVSLAEARELARELRGVARTGGDPIAHRDRKRRGELTLRRAVEDFHAERVATTLKTARGARAWLAEMERVALADFGERPAASITQGDVYRMLARPWTETPTIAKRCRQRLEAVFEQLRVAGHVSTNPVSGVEAGLPKQRHETKHHAAVDYRELPGIVQRLRQQPTPAAAALYFVILTAARASEVRLATWSEIDIEAALWIVPAERMKTGKEHRVPLTDGGLSVLEDMARRFGRSGYIFPGRGGRALGLQTIRGEMTVGTTHGVRSAFRNWAYEQAEAPREIAEAALAHAVGDAVERAYRRGDALDRRRRLMQAWDAFLHGC